MRAGVEPERIVAGVALLIVAALAAAAGGLGVLLAPILGFAPPDVLRETERSLLLTVAILWGFALSMAVLAAFVMTGRRSRLALALASVLLACAAATLGFDGGPLTFSLLVVLSLCAGALLIGTLRHLRG
jgi:hypothetical protein